MASSLNQLVKKVTFIVDIKEWAFDNIAKNIKTKLENKINIDIIYWEDFNNPLSLVKKLNKTNSDIFHFFFREHLNLIIKLMDPNNTETKKFSEKTITTHIPDYLYSSDKEIMDRHNLFDFCDGYFTTNKDLFNLYSNRTIPEPFGVIHDAPFIPAITSIPQKKTAGNHVKIVWSGNSKWGEYAGYRDYKGLNTIVRPAIRKLKENYPHIDFIAFDSSIKKTPHRDILNALHEADILLVSSVKEGTPLTLIEAMSRECAVVCTDVGIAHEVLPDVQKEFICERSDTAFYDALSRLIANPELLDRCKKHNLSAYNDTFESKSKITQQWECFFTKAVQNNTKEKLNLKLSFLNKQKRSLFHAATIKSLKTGANFARKTGLIPALNMISPQFAATYHKIIHGDGLGSSSYKNAHNHYKSVLAASSDDIPLAIYSPMWKGISASTESIFQKNSLKFPLYSTEFPEVSTHKYLNKLTDIIIKSKKNVIIYSGGSIIHLTLAQEIKKMNKNVKQYFMWHGSPAQWLDHAQFLHFDKWRSAFEAGTIDGFITVKPNLHHTLMSLGIRAYDIYNPIPNLKQNTLASSNNTINIGLFSAISSWYKNPNVQLLALAGKDITLNTNLDEKYVRNLNLNVSNINFYQHMPRHEFLEILSRQDINLYITNTECSPMTALESWAMNIPCIVSPAGDIYSHVDKELAHYLVEPKVDDPQSISKRIRLVIDNLEIIKTLLEKRRIAYNEIYNAKLYDLFKQLK